MACKDQQRNAEMARLHIHEGWTYEAIGRRFGLTHDRVRHARAALPRPRRPRSSSPADHHAGPLHGFRPRREILDWLGAAVT
jgi:hypothetical protein